MGDVVHFVLHQDHSPAPKSPSAATSLAASSTSPVSRGGGGGTRASPTAPATGIAVGVKRAAKAAPSPAKGGLPPHPALSMAYRRGHHHQGDLIRMMAQRSALAQTVVADALDSVRKLLCAAAAVTCGRAWNGGGSVLPPQQQPNSCTKLLLHAQYADRFRTSTLLYLEESSTLLDVMVLLGQYRLHRVVVVKPGAGGDITNIITQSAIVQALHSNKKVLTRITDRTLKELGLAEPRQIYSVHLDDDAFNAFKIITEKVTKRGALTGCCFATLPFPPSQTRGPL